MKVVGITGGIGSGKTTVCRIFELFGIPVFYSDAEAKKLYDIPKIKSQVVKLFGGEIISKNGSIDKKKLADIVFNNDQKLSRLNALIHPAVRKVFLSWIKKHKSSGYVIKEAAIMIESGASKHIDCLICVRSHKLLRISRIIKRDNLSGPEIKKRISEQISDRDREKHADIIIINDDKHSLIQQVKQIHQSLSKK